MRTNEKGPKALTSAATANATVAPQRYPVAYLSAYGPTGRRTRWQGMTRCGFCGGGHAHFGGTLEDLRGVKVAGCRRGRYWVVVARTYTASEVTDVAA